jgi:hypothetical protein
MVKWPNGQRKAIARSVLIWPFGYLTIWPFVPAAPHSGHTRPTSSPRLSYPHAGQAPTRWRRRSRVSARHAAAVAPAAISKGIHSGTPVIEWRPLDSETNHHSILRGSASKVKGPSPPNPSGHSGSRTTNSPSATPIAPSPGVRHPAQYQQLPTHATANSTLTASPPHLTILRIPARFAMSRAYRAAALAARRSR